MGKRKRDPQVIIADLLPALLLQEHRRAATLLAYHEGDTRSLRGDEIEAIEYLIREMKGNRLASINSWTKSLIDKVAEKRHLDFVNEHLSGSVIVASDPRSPEKVKITGIVDTPKTT